MDSGSAEDECLRGSDESAETALASIAQATMRDVIIRLHKKAIVALYAQSMPQGLKPNPVHRALAVRLKSCPDTLIAKDELF